MINIFIGVLTGLAAAAFVMFATLMLEDTCCFFQKIYMFLFDHYQYRSYIRLKKKIKKDKVHLPLVSLEYFIQHGLRDAFVVFSDNRITIYLNGEIYLSAYNHHAVLDLVKKSGYSQEDLNKFIK